jgi:ABC-2 type transport system permease protein
MNLRIFRQALRWQRGRFLAVGLAAVGWGLLAPVVYVNFSSPIKDLIDSGQFPPAFEDLLQFGSGDFFTLGGALTLFMQHPIAIALMAVFGAGMAAGAVAGELEDGTLEVILSKPVGRRPLYVANLAAVVLLVGAVMALIQAGNLVGLSLLELGDEVDLGLVPLVWLNGFLLWIAFGAFGLAASVTFDRHAQAIGLTAAFLLVNYFLEIIGSFWTDVDFLQPYSLFHYFQPGEILLGDADPLDLVVLAVAAIVPIIWALVVFPRRQLPAPA